MQLHTGILYLLAVLTRMSLLAHGKLISCLCTTSHCEEQQISKCNTTSMCFSQYLDRKDGSNPVVRGCITSKTPLLCENRKPSVFANSNWPVLLCCSTNMCNQDAIPTPVSSEETSSLADLMSTTTGTLSNEIDVIGADRINNAANMTTAVRRTPHLFSSVYVIVLVIGVCCLVVMVAIVMLVFRRQSHQLYEDPFGAVERNGYLKGSCHVAAHSDSDSPIRNLPKVDSVMYDNKVSLNT